MNLYWDRQNQVFVSGLANSQQIQRFTWYLRDQVPVVLYVVTPATAGYTAAQAPSGWSPKLSAKLSSALTGDNLVFQGTWTWVGASLYYMATIDLNTVGLIAAVEAATDNYVDLVLELTLQDANGNHRDSSQVTLRVKEDVYRGTEDTPAAATGAWPNFQWYNDPTTGKQCLRIKNDDGETLAVFSPRGV